MSTGKAQIQALIEYANQTTGKSDTHLGDAVKTLADGYGGGGNLFLYGGTNAELVDEQTFTYTLDDTSFVIGETAPTSSTVIKTAVTGAYTSPSINFDDKDIIVISKLTITPTHSEVVDDEFYIKKFISENITMISKVGNASGGIYSPNTSRRPSTMTNTSLKLCRNGVNSLSYTGIYGLYGSLASAGASAPQSATTTIKASSPTLYARCNASYESVNNMKLITACDYEWNIKTYTVDAKSSVAHQLYTDIEECWDE